MSPLSDLWSRHANARREPKTAFVLSGGAAMGALQVGMLRALIERRIQPDLILGCSVGAINGAVLAGDPSLETVGRMQDIWLDLVDRDLLPTGLLPSPVQLVRKGDAISTNERLRALLDDVLPERRFEDLAVPFECVATNLSTAGEHWFKQGELADAILASASIPAVFPPVEIDGMRFIDGAVVDDVPVRRAVEAGATRIVVLQVGGVDRPRPDARRPLDMAILAYWIARRHRLLDDLARIPDDIEVVMLPHGNPVPVRFNDMSRSAQLMDVAYRASADHLDARLDGRLPAVYGPLTATDLDGTPDDEEHDEEAELEAAHALLATASQVVDEDPDEFRSKLSERAEAIGPAMRALVMRIKERGSLGLTRPNDDDESFTDDPALDEP